MSKSCVYTYQKLEEALYADANFLGLPQSYVHVFTRTAALGYSHYSTSSVGAFKAFKGVYIFHHIPCNYSVLYKYVHMCLFFSYCITMCMYIYIYINICICICIYIYIMYIFPKYPKMISAKELQHVKVPQAASQVRIASIAVR